MRRTVLALVAIGALWCAPVAAQTPSDKTDAFEQAYAASFYTFDACGDGVAGRIYRNVLVARFAQCPFSEAARARFRSRTVLQRRRSSQMISRTIDEHDGVPVQLEGMRMTCREQRSSAEYRELRERLARFEAGAAGTESVIPEPCGAGSFTPY